ncbi:RNA-binding protein S1 [Vulcanibacillus modesticaldus]|uniref:RNA-binding protein S1 n=1 Tax=Vulcanibacillus modesticaldus TaxID=337097 RepID=A0A1D2YX72_9BACI|nr:S1 domain-containing RNA-binding protein [Vulcanibacillus modesticaldus]OEG00304.1 RNA-binding protein S1 [Vulcanibacillus modesticaldus]
MSIEIGSKLEGKVTGITHFGAFVELPNGETGLVHISEISDSYVKDVNEFLKVDDVVTVKVINVEENGKIGLSLRGAREKQVSKSMKQTRRYSRESFDEKLNKFLKDSEERLSSLRKSTDSKRGGRGTRRG